MDVERVKQMAPDWLAHVPLAFGLWVLLSGFALIIAGFALIDATVLALQVAVALAIPTAWTFDLWGRERSRTFKAAWVALWLYTVFSPANQPAAADPWSFLGAAGGGIIMSYYLLAAIAWPVNRARDGLRGLASRVRSTTG